MSITDESGTLIKIEFVCAECQNGKHECSKIWRGLGLDLRCCCSCINSRGFAELGNSEPSRDNEIGRKDRNPNPDTVSNLPSEHHGSLTNEAGI